MLWTAAEVARMVSRLTSSESKGSHALDAPDPDEATLHRLLRNVPGMVFRSGDDRARTMYFVSRGTRQLTGFDPQDLVQNRTVSFGSLIHPDDRSRVEEVLAGAVVAERRYRLAYRIRRVDGRERHVREYGQAIAREEGAVIEGFITDLREADSEDLDSAHEQERLASLAQLATRVAHDLNNVLAGIKGIAEALQLEQPRDPVLARDLADIAASVDRGSSLTRELRARAETWG